MTLPYKQTIRIPHVVCCLLWLATVRGDLMCHSFCKVLAIHVTEMGVVMGRNTQFFEMMVRDATVF